MTDDHTAKYAPARLFDTLLTGFSLQWVSVLVDLGHGFYHLLSHLRNQGMYETLEYDSSLELKDPKGKTAIFKRHQRVKFLQNHIMTFQDHAWGDGDILADYKVSPGVVADRYREGDRWNFLISLRESKSRGDVEDFYIERTVKDGFTQEHEWWQVEVWHKTDLLTLKLFFPRSRHCRRAMLHTRSDNKTVVLHSGHFQALPDGRQLLRWQKKDPRQAEVFTIRWTW